MRRQIRDPRNADEVPAATQLHGLGLSVVLQAVAGHYRISVGQLAAGGRGDIPRAAAASLARRYPPATRREISTALGLTHPDSEGTLVRRIDRERARNAGLRKDLAALEKWLSKTRNRA